MNQQRRQGGFRTLAEKIDLHEEGIELEEVTKAVLTFDSKPVSDKRSGKTSAEEKE